MYNGHGDVAALTDASGNVVATYEYDEWGNITNQTGNIDNPFTYAGLYGYVYDKETGLYFLKSRYYDSEIGRFTTRDRFMGFENRQASQNQYTYTENDPVNNYDPFGFYRRPYVVYRCHPGVPIASLSRFMYIKRTYIDPFNDFASKTNFWKWLQLLGYFVRYL